MNLSKLLYNGIALSVLGVSSVNFLGSNDVTVQAKVHFNKIIERYSYNKKVRVYGHNGLIYKNYELTTKVGKLSQSKFKNKQFKVDGVIKVRLSNGHHVILVKIKGYGVTGFVKASNLHIYSNSKKAAKKNSGKKTASSSATTSSSSSSTQSSSSSSQFDFDTLNGSSNTDTSITSSSSTAPSSSATSSSSSSTASSSSATSLSSSSATTVSASGQSGASVTTSGSATSSSSTSTTPSSSSTNPSSSSATTVSASGQSGASVTTSGSATSPSSTSTTPSSSATSPSSTSATPSSSSTNPSSSSATTVSASGQNGSNATTDSSSNNQGSSAQSSSSDILGIEAARNQIFEDLNADRASVGVAPVTRNAKLDQLAQLRAQQLITHFSHYDSSNQPYAKLDAPQVGLPTDFDCAENIAMNEETDSVTAAKMSNTQWWTNEKGATPDQDGGHRMNIRDAGNNYVGIGVAYDSSNGKWYFVQDFGSSNPDSSEYIQ